MKDIIHLSKPSYIISSASVVGEEEYSGPLGESFDFHSTDGDTFGCDTWEKSESEMQRQALIMALSKLGLTKNDISCLIAGDLVNQCSASTFGLSSFKLPFLGIYGACSTCAEALILSSVLCSAGYARRCAAVTSSHNATAERQFRFPLEYGAQRCPTCQWTVTGSGAFIVSQSNEAKNAPKITDVLIGAPVDAGINDANNMGAAMAPAAADTLIRYFESKGALPDMVLTGDLGYEGSEILKSILSEKGHSITGFHADCGLMIYDRVGQDKHAGGSGCGCSAAVLASDIMSNLRGGALKSVVFVGTGALMNPMTIQQGHNIVGIAHLVRIEA